MDIFLVRHGEAAASWGEEPDPGLSALGVEQAVAAAEYLRPLLNPGVQLISSPLKRAQETASPLASMLEIPVAIDDAFREIPAPVPLAERKNWLRGFMKQDWDEQPSGLLAWRDKALAQLQALRTPTVVFSHFLVLNAVVAVVEKHTDTLVFWPDNGSVTHLKLSANGELALQQLGAQMETVVN